ncbi:hypothetical protein FGIG_09418 [Fasciola gigantica]|uniref:Uncharacterized protein n=1 Tax=Fasciola gigantica TaxID=46835 RepID=A0A504YD98_FASGI|nr:hypothetical protein FGIG_09418 [Fasciola gigantica]
MNRIMSLFLSLLCTRIYSNRADPILGELPCTVTEECPIGTVICDLKTIWDKFGMPSSLLSAPTDASPEGSGATRKSVQITVINEAKTFAIVRNQIVSRDRIDREQYVFTKQCRRVLPNANEMNTDRSDIGERTGS